MIPKFLSLFFILLQPKVIEQLINIYEYSGNIAKTGVYKGLANHRNLTWISILIYLILSYFGYSFYGLMFFVIVLIKYYFYFTKWYYFISKDFIIRNEINECLED